MCLECSQNQATKYRDVIPGIPDLLFHVPEMLGQFIF